MSPTALRVMPPLSTFGSGNGVSKTQPSAWPMQPGRLCGISARNIYSRISLDSKQGDAPERGAGAAGQAATITSLQEPPRAVGTPRAVRARATPRRLLSPLAWISLMMGRTLAANASAASLRALMEARQAAARRGPPSFFPRALAAARAALVRSLIASRSCSATAASCIVQPMSCRPIWTRGSKNTMRHGHIRDVGASARPRC
jgi:hypothetical protein